MISRPTQGVRYSLVIPVFNEEAVLPLLLHRLQSLLGTLDAPAEAIFVDDGSRDTSSIILEAKAKEDARFRYVRLSRNFGHQIAITAGMDVAMGDAIIVMDADLQDPPEVVAEMIARWKEGFEIVQARRLSREGESAFKKKTAAIFYRLLGKLSSIDIPRDVGDFRLIDRKVLEAFREMPERDRFVRGMFAWLGFRHTEVAFHRPARAAGETKYPFWKMLKLAVSGVVSFSDAPPKAAVWVGACVSVFAEDLLAAIEGVAGEPDHLLLREAQRAGVVELVAQFLLVDLFGEPHRGGAVDEREGGLDLRVERPRSSAASAACRNPCRAGCARSDRASRRGCRPALQCPSSPCPCLRRSEASRLGIAYSIEKTVPLQDWSRGPTKSKPRGHAAGPISMVPEASAYQQA